LLSVVSKTTKLTLYTCVGDPANPMDWGMLVHKFQHVTSGLLSPARQKEMTRAVQSLPDHGLTLLQDGLPAPLG